MKVPKPDKGAYFDAYFWLGVAGVMWILTCICGVLEMALGSSAYAWVGLMLASIVLSGIAASYVRIALPKRSRSRGGNQ